jgi:hypothetical protein
MGIDEKNAWEITNGFADDLKYDDLRRLQNAILLSCKEARKDQIEQIEKHIKLKMEMISMPKEYVKIVNDNFWDLF